MGYQLDSGASRELWGITGSSTITQPPMFGHAIAELAGRGFDVDRFVAPATAALGFLLERRRGESSAALIAHPWESGLDGSPRWDGERTSFDRVSWGAQRLHSSACNPAAEVLPPASATTTARRD
ncbi:MAG: hypothetical protein JWO62_2188 [Acidimicrobiaceae bacterium]|nr:hypothetical protein [Acidimicrobiaceae bacterium]